MLVDAYIQDVAGDTVVVFVDDAAGETFVPYKSTPEHYETLVPGSLAFLEANDLKPSARIIRKEIQAILDSLTANTLKFLLESDGWYNGRDIEAIYRLWPEFFEFQKWLDGGEVGAAPTTPLLEIEAAAMIRYTASLNALRAKKRIAAEFNRKRNKLMLEEIDTAGNLVRYSPKQPPEINAQVFKYKRKTNRVYNNSVLTNLEKIQQLYELKNTIQARHPNGRFKLLTT